MSSPVFLSDVSMTFLTELVELQSSSSEPEAPEFSLEDLELSMANNWVRSAASQARLDAARKFLSEFSSAEPAALLGMGPEVPGQSAQFADPWSAYVTANVLRGLLVGLFEDPELERSAVSQAPLPAGPAALLAVVRPMLSQAAVEQMGDFEVLTAAVSLVHAEVASAMASLDADLS